jgi:nucleoside-diphosphate-sugar epimerase
MSSARSDCPKIGRLLDWCPVIDFDDVLGRTIEWMQIT